MKIATRLVVIFLSLLLGCAGARGAFPAGADDVELECLIIEGAEIVPSSRRYQPTDEMTMQEQLAVANQGHKIIRGNSTIIAVREYIGRNSAADGQRYKKLTAKLSGPVKTKGSTSVAESHFVSGSSGFVAWGFYYVSTDKLKEVAIIDHGSRRLLRVKQEMPSFRVPDGLKEDVSLSFECELKPKGVDQLSAWEGKGDAERDPFYP